MSGDELKVAPGEADSGSASPASPAPQAGEAEAPVGPPVPEEGGEPAGVPAAAAGGEGPEAAEEAGAPEPDHAGEVERDLEELAARAQKADEYLELAQRTRADFENFRRRASRDAAAAQERGVAKVVRELLPAIDNLDRALAAADAAGEGDDDGLTSGIRLVHGDVIAALSRVGVESFSPEGEAFDPQHHEAVAQQPVEGAERGTVVEVYQRGYRLGETILRPARVLVAG